MFCISRFCKLQRHQIYRGKTEDEVERVGDDIEDGVERAGEEVKEAYKDVKEVVDGQNDDN